MPRNKMTFAALIGMALRRKARHWRKAEKEHQEGTAIVVLVYKLFLLGTFERVSQFASDS